MHGTELLDQLARDLMMAEQLQALLQEEHAALTANALADLQRILDDKTPLLEQLNQHSQQRTRILDSRNLPLQQHRLVELYASEQRPALQAQLQQLETRLTACRDQNQKNGQLIGIKQKATRDGLQILRGQQDAPTLYNSQGGSTSTGQSRLFSQA